LVICGHKSGIVMVEGGANTVPEKDLIEAILFGYEGLQPLIKIQEDLIREVGKEKRKIEIPQKDENLIKKVRDKYTSDIYSILDFPDKISRKKRNSEVRDLIKKECATEDTDNSVFINQIIDDIEYVELRRRIVDEERRIDGRKLTDVRPISCNTGLLKRAHGSALFTRGETQVLTTVTLGTKEDEQRMDDLSGEITKSFMLHYNFPPFSVGEINHFVHHLEEK